VALLLHTLLGPFHFRRGCSASKIFRHLVALTGHMESLNLPLPGKSVYPAFGDCYRG